MLAIKIKRRKSTDEILNQMDRLYGLYCQGYGSKPMIETCDEKVYVIIAKLFPFLLAY